MNKAQISNQLSISYKLIGDSSNVIVFCQGAYFNMFCWDNEMINQLSQHYSILLWDYPGIGGSSDVDNFTVESLADILKQFLDNLKIRPKAITGYSMGGFVAQVFAIKYPHNIDKLVLISTHAGDVSNEKIKIQTGTTLAHGTISEKLPAMMPFLFSAKNLAISLKDKMRKIFQAADDCGYPSSSTVKKEQQLVVEWMANNSFKARLSKLNIPTLIIAGEDDRLVPFEKSKELKKLIANSILKSYTNAAHGVMFQNPKDIAKALTEFINE